MAEAKLFACAERAHLLPVFGRQLKKLASLGESASLFLHCVFDELCGRSLGYAQFGAAHELNPVVSSWRDFLALAVGLNLTSEQVRSARKHQILRFVPDLKIFFPASFPRVHGSLNTRASLCPRFCFVSWLPRTQITADLTTCGLTESFTAIVQQAIDARRSEVRSTQSRDASALATNSLKDFDWSMRVRLAPSPVHGYYLSNVSLTLHVLFLFGFVLSDGFIQRQDFQHARARAIVAPERGQRRRRQGGHIRNDQD
jgi:hypothetical protein